jgi:hypothetical protein
MSAFTSFWKDRFLVKRKSFLCMLLLLIYVSRFTNAHIPLVFRDTLETSLCKCRAVKDMNEVEYDVENIPITMSMVSVLVFCISSKRS